MVAMDSEAYRRGILLFNSADFFDAHEALEDVWREAQEPERKFLQGLIQIAVALHHHSRGNLVGAQSLMARGADNLRPYPEGFGGIRLGQLLESVEIWQRALDARTAVPALPQLVMSVTNGQ
jgi:predicted metal-dependent hydrolase